MNSAVSGIDLKAIAAVSVAIPTFSYGYLLDGLSGGLFIAVVDQVFVSAALLLSGRMLLFSLSLAGTVLIGGVVAARTLRKQPLFTDRQYPITTAVTVAVKRLLLTFVCGFAIVIVVDVWSSMR